MLREIVLPMLFYRLRPSRDRLLRAVQPMFTEPAATLDGKLLTLIDALFRSVRLERSFPRNATAAELADFTAPTLLIAAEDDPLLARDRRPGGPIGDPEPGGALVFEGESHPPPRGVGRRSLIESGRSSRRPSRARYRS